ncbi:MAG: 1-deoxy-D-xylulose 5-phosphate reductoisomerase [Bacteroidetes bacterium ADurb.Bin408]|nr:MAG: 1-deoxy-D-xylulose 5-phosphate reductoisomerase [Bacteroidetes bacterium ADurb.Bin408]
MIRLKKHIAILGSTGSIGRQTLDVIREHSDKFIAEILTAQNNADLLIKQAIEFKPNAVVIANESLYTVVNEALSKTNIKVFAGQNAVNQIIENENIDMVLLALVGYAGLLPALNAIKAKKKIALANKETLVVAGELMVRQALKNNVSILPVDSEHSAIFQCLVGEYQNPVEKIILTASGGPFRGKNTEELAKVTKKDALKHPNWSMGDKITIDSATLMNKGLEVIEARWLFDILPNQIEVVVHPQSVIHSLVQFCDGSIKAQLGLPDMKLPIVYALSYPDRLHTSFKRFSFSDYPALSFEKPDTDNFRCLPLAYEALKIGGNMPCIMNAANETAVSAFLNEKISFFRIPDIIEKCMEKIQLYSAPDLNTLINTHNETVKYAASLF